MACPATEPPLPDEAYAVALASLPGLGWRRLGALVAAGSAREGWERVRAGRLLDGDGAEELAPPSRRLETAVANWRARAGDFDVSRAWRRTRALGIQVLIRGRPEYPALLVDDPAPPAVAFLLGAYPGPDQPRVAVVGTRHCSHEGREVARWLGYGLAERGVTVVSGLALGIDGAAHQGALAASAERGPAASPFGLVASGLDVPYPARHAGLWAQVAEAGGLLSEYPPGAPATRIRFPARNRLIAAFADVVVVVESRTAGGSRHTVDAAIDRGRTVLAVPGSIRNPAAAGTNQLIAEGCAPVCDLADVLTALDLARPAGGPRPAGVGPRPAGAGPRPAGAGRRPGPAPEGRRGRGSGTDGRSGRPACGGDPADELVLDAVRGAPVLLDALLLRTGLGPVELSGALERLRAAGLVHSEAGWWSRR